MNEVLAWRSEPDPRPPTRYPRSIGSLIGAYSRRINIHNGLVYEVFLRQKDRLGFAVVDTL